MTNAIIILISILGGVLIYAAASIFIPVSERGILKGRFLRYFKTDMVDDIQDEIIKEQTEKNKSKLSGMKFISKDFADLISSSGIKLSPAEFLYIWLGSLLVPMVLFALISGSIISISAAGIIGLILPPILLKRAIKKRQELFTTQLGEALVIIGNGLKGGFSLQQSLDSVAKEMAPPISTEFQKTMREIQYGLSMEVALNHLNERVNNRDLELFTSAILTASQVGSNLTEILDTIAGTIKDRIKIKQQVRVLSAQGRMSGIIIGLLPVFLFLVLMLINPSYLEMFFTTTLGKVMIAVSVALEVAGFYFIRKIADVRY